MNRTSTNARNSQFEDGNSLVAKLMEKISSQALELRDLEAQLQREKLKSPKYQLDQVI